MRNGRAGTGSGELSYPYDVRVDPGGRQFVCEFGNSRIQIFNAQNRPVEILGEAGSEPGVFRLAARCSSGTYVRALAADLGTALGGGAHLRNLRRTAIGSYGTMMERGVDMVVAEASARFLGAARFDDELELEVLITRLGTTACTTRHRVIRDARQPNRRRRSRSPGE